MSDHELDRLAAELLRNGWTGEIVCSRCHAVHLFDVAPDRCGCGSPFLPSADPDHFTARLCCPSCVHTEATR